MKKVLLSRKTQIVFFVLLALDCLGYLPVIFYELELGLSSLIENPIYNFMIDWHDDGHYFVQASLITLVIAVVNIVLAISSLVIKRGAKKALLYSLIWFLLSCLNIWLAYWSFCNAVAHY